MQKTKKKYTLDQIDEMVSVLVIRMDSLEIRLNYITKANNLKDLPRQQ